MKYFTTLFFFLISYFLLLLPVRAQWIKYPQNPVLKATSNTWYSIHATAPHVIYEEGLFKMWFQGHDGSTFKIGSAYSTDGITWNVSPQSQITVSSPGLANGIEVVEPMVIKNGASYQMWFKEFIPGENRIRYATSTDSTTWTINPQPVFTKSQESWESTGPTNPSIIFENNEYKMWYIAAGSSTTWKLGYATSPDGIAWTRYGNNPLNMPTLGLVGGPTVIKTNNQYHMWYHTGSGMNTDIYHVISSDGIQWSCDGNCSALHIENGTFDSQGMVAPTVFKQNGKLYLWYGGLSGGSWQIGLATFELPAEPTPTETPTPTPTATPTPTPTPFILHPLILVPGFMASWNKDAVLHNKPSAQSDWKLAPFVREYDGIIQTLKNIGYIENQNLFLFSYDWRKSVVKIAEDLENYILQLKIKNQSLITKYDIIGHSLGGLVGRIWAQKYNQNKLNILVTGGSPHQGTAHVYKPLEAGELDRSNNFLWLAEKTILMLNKISFETDKTTLNTVFPVLKDLVPTYDFLKNQNNTFIPHQSMNVRNDILFSFNQSQESLYPTLHAVVGETGNTLFGFTVKNRSVLDQLLNFYPDGRPVSNLDEMGDNVILSSSSKIGDKIHVLNKDHEEIIYQKDGIKEIFNSLSIPFEDSQIIEGKGTVISPSLILLIKSSAEIEVNFNGKIYREEDGIIFIENAEFGNYRLNVRGTVNGRYSVFIGQIGQSKDIWNTIEGEITADPPTSQTDTYIIDFNSQSPLDFPINQNDVTSLFDLLNLQFSLLKKQYNHSDLVEATEEITDAKNNFLRKNYKQMRKQLIESLNEIFSVRKKAPLLYKNKLYESLIQLENLYEQTSKVANYTPKLQNLDKKSVSLSKKFATLENYLLQQKKKSRKIDEKAKSLLLMKKKIEKVKEMKLENRLSYSEILLFSALKLSEEIK